MFRWFFRRPDPVVKPQPTALTLIEAVVDEINARRKLNGRNPLVFEKTLARISQTWAENMAANETLYDGNFQGRVWSVHPNTSDSENIEYNQYEHADQVVEQWMNSPPHRKNILSQANLIGVGAAHSSSGDIYWCADFCQV